MNGRSDRTYNLEVFGGTFWMAAWLFTVGYLGLSVWEAILALIAWPYFLGVHFR
ncbi:MAG: hypothetical protein GX162_02935 [Firmicutes bacterium]|nr:hypothetical protein [Bacillota bacterium]